MLRLHLNTTRGYVPPSFSIRLPAEDIANMLYTCYMEIIDTRQRELIYDDYLEEQIYQIADILAKPSHKFAIIFHGTYGNGKTTMMMALRKMINYLFSTCNHGIGHIKRFNQQIPIIMSKDVVKEVIEQGYTYQHYDMMMIDDLGSEPAEKMHYGTIYTPIVDLLESRYAMMKYTVISTNLSLKQLRPIYGDRVADRLNEIAHTVQFLGPSYREIP